MGAFELIPNPKDPTAEPTVVIQTTDVTGQPTAAIVDSKGDIAITGGQPAIDTGEVAKQIKAAVEQDEQS